MVHRSEYHRLDAEFPAALVPASPVVRIVEQGFPAGNHQLDVGQIRPEKGVGLEHQLIEEKAMSGFGTP